MVDLQHAMQNSSRAFDCASGHAPQKRPSPHCQIRCTIRHVVTRFSVCFVTHQPTQNCPAGQTGLPTCPCFSMSLTDCDTDIHDCLSAKTGAPELRTSCSLSSDFAPACCTNSAFWTFSTTYRLSLCERAIELQLRAEGHFDILIVHKAYFFWPNII